MINDEAISALDNAYKASTQGNWRRGIRPLDTIQDTKEWLARMVDYNAEQPTLHMVAAMVDGSDPTEVLDNVEDFVIPCLTGNGTTSEANAYFLEVAHNYMPSLLASVREYRELRHMIKEYADRHALIVESGEKRYPSGFSKIIKAFEL